MKLYLLKPIENLGLENNPWAFTLGKAFGFVIRAKNEEQARIMANNNGYDEKRSNVTTNPWIDPKYSSCEEINLEGDPEIILIHSEGCDE